MRHAFTMHWTQSSHRSLYLTQSYQGWSMVAVVIGNNLGLAGSSAGVLGNNGQLGIASTGLGGDVAFVNATTGNLTRIMYFDVDAIQINYRINSIKWPWLPLFDIIHHGISDWWNECGWYFSRTYRWDGLISRARSCRGVWSCHQSQSSAFEAWGSVVVRSCCRGHRGFQSGVHQTHPSQSYSFYHS